MAEYSKIESALIHGGIYGDPATGAVNVPIYQTSTYEQPELGRNSGWEYSRTGNPTRAALEALIAELEGGTAGFAFGSGMAAITAVLSLFKAGDTIIISSNVYGGTFRVLDKVFKNFGLGYEIVDTTDLQLLEERITPDVKAILVESLANPLLTVTDLAGVAKIARSHGILSIVDNTFMTPYLQRPIALGVDIVLHSATKYAKVALEDNIPTLATCRGFQLVNIACGGSLYQDIPTMYESTIDHRDPAQEDFAYHTIVIEDENSLVAQAMGGAGEYTVNSWHHQGVKTLGEGLTVTAVAEDGMIEAFEKPDHRFMLCVQFHPEWHVDDGSDEFLSFFTMLMAA